MITCLVVSDSDSHFSEAINTYETRIGRYARIVRLKPERSDDPKRVVKAETERISAWLEKERGLETWLLDERGASVGTGRLVEMVERAKTQSRKLCYVIGGAYGVDRDALASKLAGTIRVSDAILPHSLALLVLVEQLYRVHEIVRGSGYHHGNI